MSETIFQTNGFGLQVFFIILHYINQKKTYSMKVYNLGDQSAMTNFFKQRSGMTPLAYRNR